MIHARRTSRTGQRGERVVLDLQKGEVARRLTKAITDEVGNIVAADLARLDAGDLSVAKLRSIFTPEEIRAALRRRLAALDSELDELQALEASLDERDDGVPDEWDGANGGDAARRRGAPQRGTRQALTRDADGSVILSGKRKNLSTDPTR